MSIIKIWNDIDYEVKLISIFAIIIVLMIGVLFSSLSTTYDRVYNQCIKNKKLSEFECKQLAKNAYNNATSQAATGAAIGVIIGTSAIKR